MNNILSTTLNKKSKQMLFDTTFSLLKQCKDITKEDCKKITDAWCEYDQLYKQYMSEPLKYIDELKAKDTYIKDILKEVAIKYNVEIKI